MKKNIIYSIRKNYSIKAIENIVTNSKIQQYKEQGFTILPNVFSKDYIEELKAEVNDIISKADLNELKTKFDTDHGSNEDYFLDSGDKIRFFLEQDALDTSGNFRFPVNKSINKIGHGMHDLNRKFKQLSYSREIKYIVHSVGYKKPSIVQSMYIFKNERIGGEVPPHTDNTFIITNPLSCMGVWIAFDDADSKNGGMWGVPGSHKTPTNYFMRLRYNNEKKYSIFEPNEKPKHDISNSVPIDAEKGSVVLLHGDFVHFSHANQSDKQRHAYTLHLIETENHKYAEDCWLQRKDIPFQYLY